MDIIEQYYIVFYLYITLIIHLTISIYDTSLVYKYLMNNNIIKDYIFDVFGYSIYLNALHLQVSNSFKNIKNSKNAVNNILS